MTSLTAIAALLFTALSLQETRAQDQLAESGQITDRFNVAVTNLGSDTETIRLGGIYALQRVMRDSPRDQPAAIQVLAAFVREHAALPTQTPTPDTGGHTPSTHESPAIDVQAALTVLATRDPSHDQGTAISLTDTYLAGANIPGVNFAHADLSGANLEDADLNGADLNSTDLGNVDLNGASLNQADLNDSILGSADLSGADLDHANLTKANIAFAMLIGTHLEGANLAGAYFDKTDFTGADLTGADLTGANLTTSDVSSSDLSGAKLAGAVLNQMPWCAGDRPTRHAGYRCEAEPVMPSPSPQTPSPTATE